jgi:hypothetical protein
MENLFANLDTAIIEEEIKVFGPAGIYTSGIHTITGAEVYVYDNPKFEGASAQIKLTDESGATLIEDLRTTPKEGQKQSDLLSYLFNIALVSGKVSEYEKLKTTFVSLPTEAYEDTYKNKVQAKVIRLFANTPFKIVTVTELSGDANQIYSSQRVVLHQVFRASDNASLGEIKSKSEEVGASFKWWSDPANTNSRASIKYHKDGKFEDQPCLQEALAFIQDGGTLDKKAKGLLQDGFSSREVAAKLGGSTAEPAKRESYDSDDDGSDDEPLPAFMQ